MNEQVDLPRRTLGRQGLEVSAIGFGTMGMTMAYGSSDAEESKSTIRRAYELGVTLFDTAELYGLGTGSNEKLLGEAVKEFRDEVVIATKFGYDFSDPTKFAVALDSRPEHVKEVAENSLRYLNTDRIDVFYQHRVDPKVPIEDVAGAVAELISEGKVKYFGLSEAGPEDIRKAHAVCPVSVLQTEHSIFERAVEDAVLPVVRELGIGFVAYSPLGRGFLTESVRPAADYPADDMRSLDARWQPGNFEKNRDAVAQLVALANSIGISVTQLALAWLLAQGDDVVPIPGTRIANRLEQNVAAASVTLTDEILAEVNRIVPDGAAGARYPDTMMPSWCRRQRVVEISSL